MLTNNIECKTFDIWLPRDIMTDIEWLGIIGLNKDSSELQEFMDQAGIDITTSEVREFRDSTLYNLYKDGLSFAFVQGKLDSIDFFIKDKKFQQVNNSLLPFQLTKQTTGRQFVEKFGEPLEKGGGLNSKLNIWLRWANLQVEIDEKNWDFAQDSTWNSITIFKD